MELEFHGEKMTVVGGTSGIGKEVTRITLKGGGAMVIIGRHHD